MYSSKSMQPAPWVLLAIPCTSLRHIIYDSQNEHHVHMEELYSGKTYGHVIVLTSILVKQLSISHTNICS
jgi:hypothetical protein